MILSARYIRWPIKVHYYFNCGYRIEGPHYYFYSVSDIYPKPIAARYHDCCIDFDITKYKVVEDLVSAVKRGDVIK